MPKNFEKVRQVMECHCGALYVYLFRRTKILEACRFCSFRLTCPNFKMKIKKGGVCPDCTRRSRGLRVKIRKMTKKTLKQSPFLKIVNDQGR